MRGECRRFRLRFSFANRSLTIKNPAREMCMPLEAGNAASQGKPTLLGIPFDANSSFLRGPAEAPRAIREAFGTDASNLWTEDGVDLGAEGTFYDAGDVDFSSGDAFANIERGVRGLLEAG